MPQPLIDGFFALALAPSRANGETPQGTETNERNLRLPFIPETNWQRIHAAFSMEQHIYRDKWERVPYIGAHEQRHGFRAKYVDESPEWVDMLEQAQRLMKQRGLM
jgi:hypothetical protein